MGPRAAISNTEILNTLKNFEICDKTGLKSKCNTVWKDICAAWDNRIKPVNLYFYVRQNRHNILKTYIVTLRPAAYVTGLIVVYSIGFSRVIIIRWG